MDGPPDHDPAITTAKPPEYWRPCYTGGGLLNLITSIAAACGVEDAAYAPLAGIDCDAWRQARNLVLILADGVGGDFIEHVSPGGFLSRHRAATLTSVCPTTTACAIPTMMTGLPPAGHGLTGWHVYLDELRAITAVLPLTARGYVMPNGYSPIDPDTLFCYPKIYQRLTLQSHVVVPMKIADSAFTRTHANGAILHPYHPVPHPFIEALPFCKRRRDFFGILRRTCHEPAPRKFVYGYWPDFDHIAHGAGVFSPPAVAGFLKFENRLEQFIEEMRGTDTVVLLTADHGFLDSPSDRQIHLDDHVALGNMLRHPVCGERRFAYCYLKPGTQADFEDYVATVFSGRAEAWPREKLLDEQWLGPGPASEHLLARLGDYVLAMKDDWTFIDHEPDQKPLPMIGVHGGLSRQEMLVPLCVMTA